MPTNLSALLNEMKVAAGARRWSSRQWAHAAGVRPETLSRLQRRGDCDLSTLQALANAVGLRLCTAPKPERQSSARTTESGSRHMPAKYGREEEEKLFNLCVEQPPNLKHWRAMGPSFFMGGLAVMLASARGYDRPRYLALAETLHPGVTTPEAFSAWLSKTPVRPSRFLPMIEKWRANAA